MIYLIEFLNSQIISALPCDISEELVKEFEDGIKKSHLSDSFQLAKEYYYNNKEIDKDTRYNMLRDIFDWNKDEYITCQNDFIYYTNTTDKYGMLLGGIQEHFLQELYNEYY